MKYITTMLLVFLSLKSLSQKNSIDFSALLSYYSDVGGQKLNSTGNNVLAYTSFGSFDYRISFYHSISHSKIWAFELEGSRKTLPTDPSSIQLLSKSFGFAMIGTGRVIKLENINFRLLSGPSLLFNEVNDHTNSPNNNFNYLSAGFSFGSDIFYSTITSESLRKWEVYFKTGFRGAFEFLNINLTTDDHYKPKFGKASILFGTGVLF